MEFTKDVNLNETTTLYDLSETDLPETEKGQDVSLTVLDDDLIAYERAKEELRKVATEELKYYLPIMTYANLLKLISKFQSLEAAKKVDPRTVVSLIVSLSKDNDVVYRSEINKVLSKKRLESVIKQAYRRFFVLHKILSAEDVELKTNYSLFLKDTEYLEILRLRNTFSAEQLWSMKEKALKLEILSEEKIVLIETVLNNCPLWLALPVGKFLLTDEEIIRIMNNKELSPIAKFEEIVKRIEQFIKLRNPLEELILNGTIANVYKFTDSTAEEKVRQIVDNIYEKQKIQRYLEELQYRIALTICYSRLIEVVQRIKSPA